MSIFDNIKGMSYIAESSAMSGDYVTVKMDPTLVPEFRKKMVQFKANGVFTLDKLKTAAGAPIAAEDAEIAIVTLDSKSNREAIDKEISTEVTAGRAELLTPEMAHRVMINSYYINELMKKRNEFEKAIKSNPNICETSDLQTAIRNAQEREMQFVAISLDAMKHDKRHSGLWKQFQSLKVPFNKMENEVNMILNSEIEKITATISNIQADNREEALSTLSAVSAKISNLRKKGVLSVAQNKVFENKLDVAAQKLGITAEELNKIIKEGITENMAKAAGKFVFSEQATVEQVQSEYAAIMNGLMGQTDDMAESDIAEFKAGIEKAAQAKIALIKTKNEHPEMFVKPGEKSAPIPGAAVISNKEEQTGNVYTITIKLPLGQKVRVDGMSKYIDKNKKAAGAMNSHELDRIMRVAFSKLEPTVYSLFGYEPKGDAAAAVASLGPAREFVGSLSEWATKNSLGLLGAAFGWKAGRDFGEGVGRFLRQEMVGNPGEVNPELAKFEQYLRTKYDPQKATGMERKISTAPYTSYRATANLNRAVLHEDLAPAAPAAATPGTPMNVPGMMTGAGPIVPATHDKVGSGDFPPAKKKKKRLVQTFEDFWKADNDK